VPRAHLNSFSVPSFPFAVRQGLFVLVGGLFQSCVEEADDECVGRFHQTIWIAAAVNAGS
jgi:hypothetical protein